MKQNSPHHLEREREREREREWERERGRRETDRLSPLIGLPPLLPDLQLIWIVDVVVATTYKLGGLGGAKIIKKNII